jgi:hypothetical protein
MLGKKKFLLVGIFALVILFCLFAVAFWEIAPKISSAPTPTNTPFRVFSPNTDASFLATDYFTSQSKLLQNPPVGLNDYFDVWANRCNPPVTGSVPGDDSGCIGGNGGERTEGNYNSEVNPVIHTADGNILFSSYQLANNCTLARTAYVLGQSTDQITASYGTGLTFVRPSTIPTGTMVNDCILPAVSDPSVTGILLDYEVGDGRTPAQSTAFLKQFADLVHAAGKRAVLYIDPLNSSNTQKYTGIDSTNAYTISTLFDYTTIQLENQNHYGGAASIHDQFNNEIQVLEGVGNTVDYSRLAITFDLTCNTLADASTVRSIMLQHNIPAIAWWRNEENNPDSCTSDPVAMQAKIACIVQGTCS